jgi:hypothetical protein
MTCTISWLAAAAEPPMGNIPPLKGRREFEGRNENTFSAQSLPAHQFPADNVPVINLANVSAHELARAPVDDSDVVLDDPLDRNPDLGRYRRVTVILLRRYLRYSLEAGRLPSILGSEFFRTQVTSYGVTSFEDRVIFVQDVEICLHKLDEFSQALIGRRILQEHSDFATAKLLHCTPRRVRHNLPIAIDLLSEILLEVGVLDLQVSKREKPCQGGQNDDFLSR